MTEGEAPIEGEELREMKRGLTLTEIGVVASIGMSVLTGVFSLGFVWGQVQENTDDIAEIRPKVEVMTGDIATIKANVQFLADLAREERGRSGR